MTGGARSFNNLNFTGDDFFAGSIVLEVPNSALGPKRIGLWPRTLVATDGGGWVQAERGARPLQLIVVFASLGGELDSYLAGEPADDPRFIGAFAHALEYTGGYTREEATRMAGTLLPEVLPYDPTCPAAFPHSGRTLTDDAADAFLAMFTNGKVTEDKVGPHRDLLAEFPYLGPPHRA